MIYRENERAIKGEVEREKERERERVLVQTKPKGFGSSKWI